uniref:BRCT domain-containing protein n=1 Tax=Parastrongyloides trichosuri TaxID=131310 RepID=A0A0N4Z493_PARTI
MEKNQWRGFRQVSISHDIRKKEKISRKLSDPIKLACGNEETTNKLLLQLIKETPRINRKNSIDVVKMKIEDVEKGDIPGGSDNKYEKKPKQLNSIELYECLQNNKIDCNVIYTLTKRTSSPRQLAQVLSAATRIYEKDKIKKQSLITANWLSKFETLDYLISSGKTVVSSHVIPRRCLSENALDILLKRSNPIIKDVKNGTPSNVSPTDVKIFFDTNNNTNKSIENLKNNRKRVSFSAPIGPLFRCNSSFDGNHIKSKSVKPIVKKEVVSNQEYPLFHMDYESFKAWRRGSKMSNETMRINERSNKKVKFLKRYFKKNFSFKRSSNKSKENTNCTNDRSNQKSKFSNIVSIFRRTMSNCFHSNVTSV